MFRRSAFVLLVSQDQFQIKREGQKKKSERSSLSQEMLRVNHMRVAHICHPGPKVKTDVPFWDLVDAGSLARVA